MSDTLLHWLRHPDGTMLDGATVPDGKLVTLRENWDAISGAPAHFFVYRSYGVVLDSLLWQSAFKHLKRPIAVLPAEQGYGARSEAGPWPATASGTANQSRFFFADDRGYYSKSLTVTTETWGADWVDNNFGLAGLVPPVRAAGSIGRHRLRYRVKGLKDPDLRIRLVTPWDDDPRYGDGYSVLQNLLVEEINQAAASVDQEGAIQEFVSYIDSLGLLRRSPPNKWSHHVQKSEIRLGEGATASGWVEIECGEEVDLLISLRVELSEDSERFVVTPFTLASF